MINQIRADFYRQRHSAGMLIVAVLTIIYGAVIVGYKSVGGLMVSGSTDKLTALASKNWSVIDGVHAATLSGTVLLYLFTAIFVFVIGYEFSQRVYKNTLVSGITRLQLILAKYVTLLLDIAMYMLIYFLTTVVTGLVAGRPIGGNALDLVAEVTLILLTNTFFISVIFSLAILLLIGTGSIVISSIFIVLEPILVATVAIIWQWDWVKYLDFLGAADGIAFQTIKNSSLPAYLGISVTLLVVSILSAAVVIRHKEL